MAAWHRSWGASLLFICFAANELGEWVMHTGVCDFSKMQKSTGKDLFLFPTKLTLNSISVKQFWSSLFLSGSNNQQTIPKWSKQKHSSLAERQLHFLFRLPSMIIVSFSFTSSSVGRKSRTRHKLHLLVNHPKYCLRRRLWQAMPNESQSCTRSRRLLRAKSSANQATV